MTLILRALRNFGYNGQNVEAGSAIEIDPEVFGDTLSSFVGNIAVQITDWTLDGIYNSGDEVYHSGAIWKSPTDGNTKHEPVQGCEFWTFIQMAANPLVMQPAPAAPKAIAIRKSLPSA